MASNDLLISRPVAAVTPVLSSLAGALKMYIHGIFPQGYFRDYFIDTELPGRLRRTRWFRPATQLQLSERRLPLLSVRTEVTAESSDFSSGVSWFTGNNFLRDPAQLERLINDDAGLRVAGFATERIVMRFQLSVLVETEMKAREVAMYMKRTMPLNLKTYLNGVTISAEIPADLLRAIWADLGFGDGSDQAQRTAFHRYLRQTSAGNIERVIKGSTGRAAYCFEYVTNPLLSITGVPSVSVNRDGNVVKNASVEVPMELDVVIPMTYAYRQEAALLPQFPGDGQPAPGGDLFDDGPFPYFSYARRQRAASTVPGPMGPLGLVSLVAFVTDDLDPEVGRRDDVTDFTDAVSAEVREYVDFLRSDANFGPGFTSAVLWSDGVELGPDEWEADLASWSLTIAADAVKYRTKYVLGIYADLTAYAAEVPGQDPRPRPPTPYYPDPAGA